MRSCSKFRSWLMKHWERPSILGWWLLPCSWVFNFVAKIRKSLYQRSAYTSKVPVVIVGNISVGGTGKTPLVLFLAELLQYIGYKPAIVTRGYQSKVKGVVEVSVNDHPARVGDEALLLKKKSKCPVVISTDRVAAVKYIESRVDIILCDDGLQHYKLNRDFEVAVIDKTVGFGNGYCLPMGPLREPVSRLDSVDMQIVNGEDMSLVPKHDLVGNGQKINAVAGIGNPNRFFAMLREAGYEVEEHAFPDHHKFTRQDFVLMDNAPIFMTEKDAVKCVNLGVKFTAIPVKSVLQEPVIYKFLEILKEKVDARSESVGHTSVPNMQREVALQ